MGTITILNQSAAGVTSSGMSGADEETVINIVDTKQTELQSNLVSYIDNQELNSTAPISANLTLSSANDNQLIPVLNGSTITLPATNIPNNFSAIVVQYDDNPITINSENGVTVVSPNDVYSTKYRYDSIGILRLQNGNYLLSSANSTHSISTSADVELTAPSEGDTLSYTNEGKWINSPSSSGLPQSEVENEIIMLNNGQWSNSYNWLVSNTNITTQPNVGDTLQYTANGWTNITSSTSTINIATPNNYSANGYILANFGLNAGAATYDMDTSGLITVHWNNHGLTAAQNGAGITLHQPINQARDADHPLGGIELRSKWYEFASNLTYVDGNTFTCQATITPLPLANAVSGVSLGSSAEAAYQPLSMVPIYIPANSIGPKGYIEMQVNLWSPNSNYGGPPYLIAGFGTTVTGMDNFVKAAGANTIEGGVFSQLNSRLSINYLINKSVSGSWVLENCDDTSTQQGFQQNETTYASSSESRFFVDTTQETAMFFAFIPNGTANITGNLTLIIRSIKAKIFKSG